MSIDIQKPEPLQIGNRFHYTLSSYEPVTVELTVPLVTNEDVEMALAGMVAEQGAKPEDLTPEWIREHFKGAESLDDLREAIRRQLTDLNSRLVEEEKPNRCAAELAKRLRQSVPASEVADTRRALEAQLEQQIAQEGASLDMFLAQTGMSRSSLDALLDQEAVEAAEQTAAMDAYVEEKGLKISDSEIPAFLGLDPSEGQELLDEAAAHGQMDELRHVALRTKAMRVIAAESSCEYHHETPDEAKARVDQYRAMGMGGDGPAPAEKDSGFKLV